ncbi:MAG: hypothetical protein WCV67_01260 [Victivallaceae bacterium]|jgi:hypothetical protein
MVVKLKAVILINVSGMGLESTGVLKCGRTKIQKNIDNPHSCICGVHGEMYI